MMFLCICALPKPTSLSASGDVRPFAANADGTVLGEGVGLLVLKRLDDAQRDKDRIYAVIKGVGTGSDGKSQSIYAPRALLVRLQRLRAPMKRAGVDPEPGSACRSPRHWHGRR